jgi:transcriptional regulator with XRE-family HTH domain
MRVVAKTMLTTKPRWIVHSAGASACVGAVGTISRVRAATLIRRERERRGLSQERLAKLAGSSQAQISEWENGHHAPRQQAVEHLLGVIRTVPVPVSATKECAWCGEEFRLPSKGNWRYCPAGTETGGKLGCQWTRHLFRLRAEARERRMQIRVTCDVCGAVFEPWNSTQKRCGPECSREANRRKLAAYKREQRQREAPRSALA